MRTWSLAPLTVVAALAVALTPSADAKFRLTLTIEPAQPVATRVARVILRADVPLANPHGIRLSAVGPWRNRLGQGFLEIRLQRIGPRRIGGTVRFPYPGRWHLDVPASAATAPFGWWIRVRSRA
jgi:hypothetical protein